MSCTNGLGIENILAYRHGVYELLRRIFLWEFPLELLTEIVETAKAGSSTEETECLAESTLRGYLKTLVIDDLPNLHRDLHIAYTRMFVGPHHLPTPPYESVYIGTDKLLMQNETVNVKTAYARNGFHVASAHRVLDDNIGIELEFMCALNKACFDALREKNHSKALELVSAQQEFCDRHLLRWIPEFCDDIVANSTFQFWKNVAALTREFVQEEPAALSSLLDTLTELAEVSRAE